MNDSLEVLVKKANSGDKKALEKVIIEIKDMVYNLSLKMLLFHDDANDATQEILIKVVTHLSTFNYKSKFKTWVYRVAPNYLLTQKGKKSKEFSMPFEDYARLIDTGQSDEVSYTQNEGELLLWEEEVRIGCTQGLLLCLNELDRMVYILSVILDFNSIEYDIPYRNATSWFNRRRTYLCTSGNARRSILFSIGCISSSR